MPTSLPPLVVDPCPDALGFSTIRVADGSKHGDTEQDPVATVYLDEFADVIAEAPAMLTALRDVLHETTTDVDGLSRDEALTCIASVAGIVRATISRIEGAAV